MKKASKARARHENFDIRTFVFWNRSLVIGDLQLDALLFNKPRSIPQYLT